MKMYKKKSLFFCRFQTYNEAEGREWGFNQSSHHEEPIRAC